jgi:hypothetical protein
VAQLEVPSSQVGYEQLLGAGVDRLLRRGLASVLGAHGEWVTEIDRPKRPRGRNGAKRDPLDAIRAGRRH